MSLYPILPLTDGIAYGVTTQAGTPTPSAPISLVNAIEAGAYQYERNGNTYKVTLPTMRSVGSVADTWNADTGAFTQRPSPFIFDGTEEWVAYSGSYPNTFYTLAISDAKYDVDVQCLCNYYPGKMSASGSHYTEYAAWFQSSVTYPRFYICDERYTSATDLKTSLAAQYAAGTPVTVYYQLATPVTSTINPELIWAAPVTDRTAADAAYARKHPETAGLKGNWSAADYNRAKGNLEYIAEQLNLYGYPVTLQTMPVVTAADLVWQAYVQPLIDNAAAVTNAFVTMATTPDVPPAADPWNWSKVNDLERILYDTKALIDNMVAAFTYCGETYCGEVYDDYAC